MCLCCIDLQASLAIATRKPVFGKGFAAICVTVLVPSASDCRWHGPSLVPQPERTLPGNIPWVAAPKPEDQNIHHEQNRTRKGLET
jgi:hypothetical protein